MKNFERIQFRSNGLFRKEIARLALENFYKNETGRLDLSFAVNKVIGWVKDNYSAEEVVKFTKFHDIKNEDPKPSAYNIEIENFKFLQEIIDKLNESGIKKYKFYNSSVLTILLYIYIHEHNS